MSNSGVNSGVGAQSGFALQRNTAIYILLNNYKSKFSSPNYFLCLEHHDDFVFCFLDENGDAVLAEAYQSKKKSPHRWTVNKELTDILVKLLKTGTMVRNDLLKKTVKYQQKLHFTSNSSIFIESKLAGNVSVDEERTHQAFSELDPKIQSVLIKNFEASDIYDSAVSTEYDNLHFLYIELTRTAKEQRNLLIGKLGEIFGKDIYDREAAIDTIFSLFQDVELVYNQGGAGFLDESKRVNGLQITDALKVITTKSKAYDYWRSEKKEVSLKLNIKPFERDGFESFFISSFDLFKSLIEAEHQKILRFSDENYKNCTSTSEEDCVLELFDIYKKTRSTKFMDLELKSVLYAAYFQVCYKKGA